MASSAKRSILGILAVAIIIFVLYKFGVFNPKHPATAPSSTPSKATIAEAQIITPGEVESKINATGTLLANEEVELRSEINGRIITINFTEGAPVKLGALLVKMNDADLRASLKKLEIDEDLAQHEEERARKLFDSKLQSQEEYEISQNKLLSVRADIEKVRSDIAKTEIFAPFNGIIGLRSVSQGSYITSDRLIATVQQINPIKIEFSVPEKYAGIILKGTRVSFTLTGSSEIYTGSVYAIEPKIDPITRTVKIRATSSNASGKLLPGSFAKIEIILQKISHAISVATSSIVPQLQGQKVFLYHNGKAFSQDVATGIRGDSSIQVISGLTEGDTLITTGLLQLRDGMPVALKVIR